VLFLHVYAININAYSIGECDEHFGVLLVRLHVLFSSNKFSYVVNIQQFLVTVRSQVVSAFKRDV
jgi:hypothetical protein